jgi:LysM repeat protein
VPLYKNKKEPGKSYLMNVRVKKTSLLLISLLLVVSGELRGEQGAGTAYKRKYSSSSSVRSKAYRPVYRSYEDYIPEKRNPGKKEYKNSGKYRKKKNGAVKRKRKPARRGSFKHYCVKKGDTLYRISKKFRVTIKEITKVNRLKRKNSIRTGMRLKIPVGPKIQKRRISKKTKKSKKGKRPGAPAFKWPLNMIKRYCRDGKNGVKPIGILIKGRTGSKVLSSAGGIVKKIGKMRGYGTYVVVMHKNRYITVYSKLGSVKVHEGKNLRRGDIIGYPDSNRTLHFQINKEGKSLNPLRYLGKKS